jgi:LPXTG-motif cell wall-anchored protein
VDYEVPAAALKPEFVSKVDISAPAQTAKNNTTYIFIGVVAVVLVAAVAFYLLRRAPAPR